MKRQDDQQTFEPAYTGHGEGQDSGNQERGVILVIVLVLIFAVTLALMAYLYLNKNNTLIASNLAVQNAAQEATDQGLQNAAQWLQQNNPQINPPSYYFSSMVGVPTNYGSSSTQTNPVAPAPAFWLGCASASTCYQLPQPVQYGPFSFAVQYVIFPSTTNPVPLPGYQITGVNAPTANYYVVFIHAQKAGSGGGLGVTVQSVVRVVQ